MVAIPITSVMSTTTGMPTTTTRPMLMAWHPRDSYFILSPPKLYLHYNPFE